MFAAEITIVDWDAACHLNEGHHKYLNIEHQVLTVALDQVRDVRHQLNNVSQEVHELR